MPGYSKIMELTRLSKAWKSLVPCVSAENAVGRLMLYNEDGKGYRVNVRRPGVNPGFAPSCLRGLG